MAKERSDVSGKKEGIARRELAPAVLFLIAAVAVLTVALLRSRGAVVYLKPLLFQLSCVFFIAAGTFLTAFLTAAAQVRGPRRRPVPLYQPAKALPAPLEDLRRRAFHVWNKLRAVDWRGDWLPVITVAGFCAIALFAAMKGWRNGGVMPPLSSDPWIVGTLVGLAFPLLVLERSFAGLRPASVPEGKSLTYALRLVLFTLMGLALAYVLRWFALPFSMAVEHTVIIVNALVALELLLRSASYIFMPLPPLGVRRHATSLVASLLRLQRPSLKGIQASVSGQFGIDLGRSWALGFIRRAALPMLGGLAVSAWLLTGVTTYSISERAVYEVFGVPQSVLHPGLHVHLPWPFGRLRPVEYGVVHQIPIAFLDEEIYGTAMPEKKIAEAKPTIEGQPPVSADRLWEASRPTEASYLVASNQNGRENFEVINVDLRIVYRIGMSDRAAMSAAYSLESPENLIRAAAGRMLARYFARYTLSSILGQDRETFIRNFQKELQARLNTLSASVDILGVVIETIHPPAGAAEAYQQVQAASIDAVTKVANARGDAVRDVRQAEADATEARDSATAQAAETVAEAKVGTALFAGDVQAYRAGGQAFLFEKRLTILGATITADTPVTILDSRIPANQMQMLQMRAAPASSNNAQ